MEDLLGHANTLKSIRNEVESKKQEEERQRQAELDILKKQSDERASQFIEIMRDHEIPQVDVIYTSYIPPIDRRYSRGSYEKHLIGRGWVLKDYEDRRDSSFGSDGIVLLEDLRSLSLNWESKVQRLEGTEAEGKYVSIGETDHKVPNIIDKALRPVAYADIRGYSGLDVLGEALIRYGIV